MRESYCVVLIRRDETQASALLSHYVTKATQGYDALFDVFRGVQP